MSELAWQPDITRLHSEETGHDYQLWVEPPGRYPGSDKSYPVVVCLDAVWTYGAVRDAFRILSLGQELPEAIVVGVAHDDPEIKNVLQYRAVDFTPTPWQPPGLTGVRLPAEEVGRSAQFRRFLLGTVLPMVHDGYRTTGDVTLVGHSFSALFGVETLLDNPATFSRWVLPSPSVWWQDFVMFEREAAHGASGADLPTRVFMSRGGDEPTHELGRHEEFKDQMLSHRRPGLRLDWATFPGETHQSVISAAVSRGLRAVFKE